MAGVHIDVRGSSRHDAALGKDAAGGAIMPALKLIALWLAVLLPLAYGVFQGWQEAKALFGG